MAISISLLAEPGIRRRRLAVGALAVVATVGSAFALHRLSNSVVFDVREVNVSGAAHRLAADIVRLAAIEPGASVIWLDEGVVERRIEADPWIADATVTTSLPGAVRISVVERSAVATAVVDGAPVLLAEDGTLLGPAPAGAPLIRVEDRSGDAGALSAAAAAIGPMPPALVRDVERVTIAEDGSLEIRLDDGSMVRYGVADDLGAKARALVQVRRWAEGEGLDLERISLVSPANPGVVLVD